MKTIKNIVDAGGPAFPNVNPEVDCMFAGMTLRDWFAGQALAGMLAGGFADTIPHDDVSAGVEAAHYAYMYAEAMLARSHL